MILDSVLWIKFSVAIAAGLLIGTERERDQSLGLAHSSVGVRSFAIATLLGAVSALLSLWLLVAVVLCVLVLVVIAYEKHVSAHPGITTELAFIFAVLLGGLSMTMPELAAAVAIVLAILLS